MKQHRLFLFFLLGFCSISLLAQTNVGLRTIDIDGEKKINEEAIESLAYSVLNSSTDQIKDSLNNQLKEMLKNELSKAIAFPHSFESVQSISILTPPDSAFRLFNWNIPYSDGTYSYECIVLKPKGKPVLLDNTNDSLVENEWIPALYYNVIAKKTKFQTYYTVLGWKGNDRLTTKKIIDIFWFGNNGDMKFGAPIFKAKKGKKTRIVFEYAAQNAMKLNYNTKIDRIEFDHLSPSKQSLTGIYEYYGPDLSFDAYQWEENYWVLKEDIDSDKGLKKKKAYFEAHKDSLLKKEPIYQPK